MILVPNETVSASPNWVAVGETLRHDCLDDSNLETDYVKSAANGREMVMAFTSATVAEADIESITSVQFRAVGRSTNRANASLVDIAFEKPTSGYSETASFASGGLTSYTTVNGTVRNTDVGGANWRYDKINDLQMLCTKNGTINVHLTYVAFIVVYVEATVTDNAVFFGTNF